MAEKIKNTSCEQEILNIDKSLKKSYNVSDFINLDIASDEAKNISIDSKKKIK
jgi:hypothetical protein